MTKEKEIWTTEEIAQEYSENWNNDKYLEEEANKQFIPRSLGKTHSEIQKTILININNSCRCGIVTECRICYGNSILERILKQLEG